MPCRYLAASGSVYVLLLPARWRGSVAFLDLVGFGMAIWGIVDMAGLIMN
jgi:hypothetical protein